MPGRSVQFSTIQCLELAWYFYTEIEYSQQVQMKIFMKIGKNFRLPGI